MVLPQMPGKEDLRRWKGGSSKEDPILRCSIAANIILMLTVIYCVVFIALDQEDSPLVKSKEMVWHGGHPTDSHPGSCWCGGSDGYCMCTPNLAIDLIITSGENHEYLWLVRRKDTSQLATMGGFVEIDEAAEHAVKRELQEEMGVETSDPPHLFGLYSDPRRDNRRRTVSAVYVVHLGRDVTPHAGDDAKEVKRIRMEEIEQYEFFADHLTILVDYRSHVQGKVPETASHGDFAPDISRSTCVHTVL